MKRKLFAVIALLIVIFAFPNPSVPADPQAYLFTRLKDMGAKESCNPPVDTTSRALAGKKLAEYRLNSKDYDYTVSNDTLNFKRVMGLTDTEFNQVNLHSVRYDGTAYIALFIVGPDYCPPPPGSPAGEVATTDPKKPKPNVTLYGFLFMLAVGGGFWLLPQTKKAPAFVRI